MPENTIHKKGLKNKISLLSKDHITKNRLQM